MSNAYSVLVWNYHCNVAAYTLGKSHTTFNLIWLAETCVAHPIFLQDWIEIDELITSLRLRAKMVLIRSCRMQRETMKFFFSLQPEILKRICCLLMSVPITGECSNCQLTRTSSSRWPNLSARPKLEISVAPRFRKELNYFRFEYLETIFFAT